MQSILSDHNCEGQAEAIFRILCYDGLASLLEMELLFFEDAGLHKSADDEKLWQLCQEKGYLLLTGNRTTSDEDKSLELTIQRLVQPDSLPVITIDNLKRVKPDPVYCRKCAENLAEIVYGLERYRGVPRLFIPW